MKLPKINLKPVKNFLKGRNMKFGTSAVVLTLGMLAIIWFVSLILSRHPIKIDLTENKIYTLSSQSIKIMKELKTDVKVTAFVKKTQGDWKYVEYMLSEMGRYSSKFKFELVDGDIDPVRIQQYAVNQPNTVVFESGNKRKDIKPEEIFQQDPYGQGKPEPMGEQAFINAVLTLTEETQKTIYFTEGHKELVLLNQKMDGISEINKLLKGDNYVVKTVNIAKEGKLPEDCNMLVVAGPALPFGLKEAELVKEYLKNGGKAIFMIDSTVESGLGSVFEYWNLKLDADLVLDKKQAYIDMRFPVPNYKMHPITNPLDAEKIPSFFPLCRSISAAGRNMEKRTVTKDDLLVTAESSWGETDLSGKTQPKFDEGVDVKAPLVLAAAVSEYVNDEKKPAKDAGEAKETQFVLFGNARFITNAPAGALGTLKGNFDVFVNSVNWMLKQENKISVRAKTLEQKMLNLGGSGVLVIRLITIVFVPLAVIGIGVYVWWKRRSK